MYQDPIQLLNHIHICYRRKRVSEDASIHEFVSSLPDACDTVLQNRGGTEEGSQLFWWRKAANNPEMAFT